MKNKLLIKHSKAFYILLVIFIFSTITVYSQTPTTSDLKFVASLDKDKYLINELIWLTIFIQNMSNDKVYGLSIEPIYGNIYFHLVSTEGESLKGEWLRGTFGEIPTLDPGEKDMISINFLATCWFGIESEDAVFDRFLSEGEYILQVELRVYPHPKWQKEKFSIFTDKLRFKVEKPKGQEKKVHDLLIEGYRNILKEQKGERGTELLRKIINDYSKSVYVDAAYWRLPFMFNYVENVKKYINTYPNSGYVWQLQRLNAPDKKEERKKFFEEIIEKYPNTKASAYAKILIDKWRKGKL